MKNWIWIIILVGSIFAMVIYLMTRCFLYVCDVKKKMQGIKVQIEEIYYFISENNRLLSKLEDVQQKLPTYHFDYSWSINNPIICHALGEIDGIMFTESKEAFEKHYNNGSRIFELDFSLTADREPVVLHDWSNFQEGNPTGLANENFSMAQAMPLADFEQVKILGKYTPITLKGVIQLAQQYGDVYFIISVKSMNQQYNEDVRLIFHKLFNLAMAADETLWERFILHAYSMEFLHRTMEEFRFKSAIYRLRRYIHPMILAEQLKGCGIAMITTTIDECQWGENYLHILHENDIKVIFCSLKDKKTMSNRLLRDDIDMVMTPYGEDIH